MCYFKSGLPHRNVFHFLKLRTMKIDDLSAYFANDMIMFLCSQIKAKRICKARFFYKALLFKIADGVVYRRCTDGRIDFP